MIPYDTDPSLHPAEPAPPQLDDGFSPPSPEECGDLPSAQAGQKVVDPSLWAKSAF